MALVKKLKAGGWTEGISSQGQSFADYLTKRLDSTNFTSKGEREARDTAAQFLKLSQLSNFNDIYAYDPVKHEYSIDSSKITDPELQKAEWGGSRDAINKNLFGSYTGNPDRSNYGEENSTRKKYNSLVASIYNDWKTSSQNVNPQVTIPRYALDKSFRSLEDYMTGTVFGGNDASRDTALKSWTTDDVIKQKVAKYSKENAEDYLKDYETNKGIDKFTGTEHAQAIKAITDKIDFTKPIDDNTWNSLVDVLNRTGSNPNGFLLSDERKKQIQGEYDLAHPIATVLPVVGENVVPSQENPENTLAEILKGEPSSVVNKTDARTFAGQDTTSTAYDVAGIAGLGASFVPGPTGSIGAGVVMGADIGKILHEEGANGLLNHKLDLGLDAAFVALSFFGLGGVKSLIKAGQVGMDATKIAKLTKTAEAISKGIEGTKELEAVGTLTKAGFNTLEEAKGASALLKTEKPTAEAIELATKLVGEGKPIEETMKLASQALDSHIAAAETLKGATTKIIGSQTLGNLAKKATTTNFAKVATAGKYGLGAFAGQQAISGGVNIYKDWKEDGVKNTNPEDWKKVVMGISFANVLKANAGRMKAITNQAERASVTNDKTAFNLLDSEGKLIDTGQVKGIIKPDAEPSKSLIERGKSLIGKGTEPTKEQAEASLNNLKNKISSAYKETHGRDLTPEELTQIDTKNLTHSYGQSTGKWTLGTEPKLVTGDRGTDFNDYKLARKHLGEGVVTDEKSAVEKLQSLKEKLPVKTPEIEKTKVVVNPTEEKEVVKTTTKPKTSKEKVEKVNKVTSKKKVEKKSEGGILKMQNAGKIPFRTMEQFGNDFRFDSKTQEYNKPWLDYQKSIDDNWFNKYGSDLNKQILANKGTYQVKNASDVQRLLVDKKIGTVHNFVSNLIGKPTVSSGLISSPMTPKVANINTSAPTTPAPNTTTLDTDGLNPPAEIPYTSKPYIDPTRFVNLAQFVNTMVGNKNILKNQLTAASKFPILQTSPLVYMRTSTPNTIIAEQQNRINNNIGKNIAENTNDWGKGISARLQANAKNADITSRAQQADIQRNDAIKGQELSMNTQIGQRNLQIINANKSASSNAEKNMSLVMANKTMADTTARNTLLKSEAMTWPMWQQKKATFDLRQKINDPNLISMQKYLAKLSSPEIEQLYRDKFT